MCQLFGAGPHKCQMSTHTHTHTHCYRELRWFFHFSVVCVFRMTAGSWEWKKTTGSKTKKMQLKEYFLKISPRGCERGNLPVISVVFLASVLLLLCPDTVCYTRTLAIRAEPSQLWAKPCIFKVCHTVDLGICINFCKLLWMTDVAISLLLMLGRKCFYSAPEGIVIWPYKNINKDG